MATRRCDPVASQRDCDDTNPDVHPGAVKKCADATHDWACDGNPRGGCVTCDLDGDGYQRKDVAANCPDLTDIHPGQTDCDDNDRGVFPGSTKYAGATLVISDLKSNEGGGSVAAALRRLCANKTVSGTAAQDADCDGSPQLGCPPATAGGKTCDVDGDGFPNANSGCNNAGLPLDCDDNDSHTFPGAPDKCGDGKAQNCSSDTACTMDADKDGYNSDVDCNDADPTKHPFATELCNGVDDDCDGLIDELNPDDTGKRMQETHGGVTTILSCNDSSVGDCGLTNAAGTYSGRCVCSGLVPGKHAAGRQACPGTRDDSTTAPKCFGATQPGLQTCLASQPHDEDCDGRTDAPDGEKLKEYGEACGVTTGECRAGKVIACDRTKINKFSQQAPGGFKVSPAFNDERRFLLCDGTAAYPSADLCDLKDNDCNGITDDCSGSGAPKCCSSMCVDLSSTFDYCGSCTGGCNMISANVCTSSKCMCGTNPACSGTLGRCKNSTSCVQCTVATDCKVPGALACNTTSNTCVQCTGNGDCMGMAGTPVCNTTTNKCVACVGDGDCMGTPATPACDTASNTCVACTPTKGCDPLSAIPACDTTTRTCVQCIGMGDCAGMATAKVCKTATHQCVQCVGTMGCGTGMQCTNTNTCVQCVDDTGCVAGSANPACDTTAHTCVPCYKDDKYCKSPTPKCDPMANQCYQCLDSTNCSGTTPACDNSHLCVECTKDANCTGVPGKPSCDKLLEKCVECQADADCKMPKPLCIVGMEKCVECKVKMDCKNMAKPECEPGTNSCVECLDAAGCTDPAKPVCDSGAGKTFTCGCFSPTDCGAMTCDMLTHTCS